MKRERYMKAKGKVCSHETCSLAAYARGWCRQHYFHFYFKARQAEEAKRQQAAPKQLTGELVSGQANQKL